MQDVYYLMTAGGVCVTQISAALNSQAYNPPQGSNKESTVSHLTANRERLISDGWVAFIALTALMSHQPNQPSASDHLFFNLLILLGAWWTLYLGAMTSR